MSATCPHCGHETEAATCPLCGSDVTGAPSGREDPGAGGGAGVDGGGAAPVPWEDPSVPFPEDLLRTWRESLFGPTSFFRGVTDGAGFARPLLYFLLATVAGAAFSLFWDLFPLFSPPGWAASESYGVSSAVVFFLSPFFALASLVVSTLVYHLGVVVLAPERRGMAATARVVCYAAGPAVLAAVPVLGGLAGLVWGWVLQVVGIREVHRTTTGRAVVAVFWVWIVFFLLTAGLVLLVLSTGMGGEGWPPMPRP